MNESAVGFVFVLVFIILAVVGCCRYWHARRQLDQRVLSSSEPLHSGQVTHSYGSAQGVQVTPGLPVYFGTDAPSESRDLPTSDVPPWVQPDWAQQSRYATNSSPIFTERCGDEQPPERTSALTTEEVANAPP